MFRCYCIHLIVFAALSLGGANATASEPFQVGSYVPERFTDVTFVIAGAGGISGSQTDRVGQANALVQLSRGLSSSQERDNHSFRLSSRATYDFVTVPRYLSALLSVSGSGSAASNDYFYDREDTTTAWRKSVRNEDNKQYGLSIVSAVGGGQYFSDNGFVSVSVNHTYRYSEHPDNSSYRLDSSIYPQDPVWSRLSVRETDAEVTSDGRRHTLRAEVAPGWGHVYEGRFAATAMYMVGELRSAGLVAREPSYDEMLSLTEIIYQFRQKHAIDYRLHKIEALDSVISYLQNRQVIADSGPYGPYLIQDVWDYFGGFLPRPFGWKVSGGMSLDYDRRVIRSETDLTESWLYTLYSPDSVGAVDTLGYGTETETISKHREEIQSSPAMVFRATYAKPLSLRWQMDVAAGCQYFFDAYESSRQDEISQRSDYNRYYNLFCSARAEYAYDMRTRVSVTAEFDRSSREQTIRAIGDAPPLDFGPPRKEINWALVLRTGVTYRISIPTTLTCNLVWNKRRIDLSGDDPYENDISSYSLAFGVSHQLW